MSTEGVTFRVGTKVCTWCGEEKSKLDFYKGGRCKACVSLFKNKKRWLDELWFLVHISPSEMLPCEHKRMVHSLQKVNEYIRKINQARRRR